MFQPRRTLRGDRGFTLVEMTIALVVFAVIGLAVYGVLIRTNQSKEMGSSIANAQQNARMALDTILRDLREAGYGISPVTQVPIETASEYRITFVVDRDEDGVTDPGERVTYFLDPDQSDPVIDATPNPDDYLLRRIISDATDLEAQPGAGKGDIVAYGMTQRTPGNADWNVRLFDYFGPDGTSLLGATDDSAGAEYGVTVPDSLLGKPSGSGWRSQVRTVEVQVVAEATHRDAVNHDFRQVRVSGRIHPRNIGAGGRNFFSENGNYDPEAGGGGDPDSTGGTPDTTTTPPDTTEVVLPPEEPPIRIPTERVLSLTLAELHEQDSSEGSAVTVDHQHDLDILIGTQSGGSNNLAVWFEGLPDKYNGRLYNSVANYHGYSAHDINHLVHGELDGSTHGALIGGGLLPVNEGEYVDVAAAVATGAFTGGFEVWLNQGTSGREGHLGTGSVTTTANFYYSNTSGRGKAIGLGDFDLDGDLDVVLGTNTAANAGKLEFWSNQGSGVFLFQRSVVAAGDVNAVAVADFDEDGLPDVAAGTKTSNSNRAGSFEVWRNRSQTVGPFDFGRVGVWVSRGQVKALAAGSMNLDGHVDVVAGLQTNTNAGEIELWLNDGTGTMSMADYVGADNVVLSVAVGQIDFASSSLDIVAGTADRSVQAWFCDPTAATRAEIIPPVESWADANTGGLVNAVSIAKVQTSVDTPGMDLLNDVVCGTAINTTSGEIVIYLNPYVWTLPDTVGP